MHKNDRTVVNLTHCDTYDRVGIFILPVFGVDRPENHWGRDDCLNIIINIAIGRACEHSAVSQDTFEDRFGFANVGLNTRSG